VKLTKSGQADITAASVVVVTSTQIVCILPLSGATTGQWNVVVTNPDMQYATLTNGFTVTLSTPPTVSLITPSTGVNISSINITNLAGTGFISGATVKLTKSGQADITAASVVVVTSTQIVCILPLSGATTGQWNVVVTNPDMQYATLTNGFTVTLSTPPTVSLITPSTGVNISSINITNLAGTGFISGATVKITKSGQADLTATSVVVQTSTQIACTLPLADAATGQWNVVVTNPDTQYATLTNGFTIILPTPTISGITPSSGVNISSVNITNLAGTGFVSGATVKITKSGQADMAAIGVVVISSSQITCILPLAGSATGQWNVVVTNPDTQYATLTNSFNIVLPTPTISGITPSSGVNISSINITNLSGTGFISGATVKLTKSGQADMAAIGVVVISSSQITCILPLAGATTGQWNVVVTNPDTQYATLTNGFNIVSPPPTISGITPSSGVNISSINITNLSGTGFISGATVKITKSGQADISAIGVVVISSSQITCILPLAGAATGQWNVVVTNPDTQYATLTNGFIVTVGNTCQAMASVGSGSWSNQSIWSTNFVPTACNAVTIAVGHTVTLDTLIAVSSGTVINGTLKASRVLSSSWTLVGGDINVNPGGTLDYGTEADVIPTTITAHLVLALGTYAGQYGIIVNNGGNFTIRGSAKTPYAFASASIGAGDTSLTVYGSTSVAGWQSGDVITIGPTSGSGTDTTDSRTIISITGGNPYTINWSGGALGTVRTLTAGTPIIVGNLTRNVLVRSSGTNVNSNSAYIQNLVQTTTNFVLTHGEFAYLGSNIAGKYGITFNGALTQGAISSSTVRNGNYGIYLNASSTNTMAGNNFYANYIGIIILGFNNTLTGNNAYSNSHGISLNGSNNTLTGNNAYSNSNGIYLSGFSNNTLTGNNTFANTSSGIVIYASSNNTLTGNNAYSNSTYGGITLWAPSNNNTMAGNNLYSNSYGIYAQGSSSNTVIDGNIGYNAAGDSLKDDTAEIYFSPDVTVETLVLKGAHVNPTVGISPVGMDVAGASLISYNQDADTGTVRIWGNYQLAGSTLTLDHAQQLYASANTTPKLMRGTGHSITLVTTNDAATLSELITVKHTGGNSWTVTGSASGVLGTFTQGVSGYYDFTNSKVNFRLTVGGTINTDDMLDFVTIAASKDANVQKKLLFGPAASTFNNGRSKLEVDSTGGIVLRGKTDGTAPTLVDLLGAGSTYYTFVDSGAFMAAYSTFTNMDQSGIQLSGNKGVAISSSTFDYLGFAPGTNTYITARNLTSNATFYNVAFNLSRSSAGYASAYNVRVEGVDSGLNWNFIGAPAGALWGENNDYDPNNKVAWNGNSGAYIDCGYRIFDGTATLVIACEPPGAVTSPLRIAKNGQIYGIALVPVEDINASKQRIKTTSGVKALRKY